MKMPKTKTKSIIAEFLNEISELDQKKTNAQMLIAAKIDDAIKAKNNWKKRDLLEAMGKKTPSLVTKWLSGTHNFTVDTLVELENALDIELLDLSRIRKMPIRAGFFSSESVSYSPSSIPTPPYA